ncbi:MAG: methylmalonyl-CoA mutase family protein [Mycobacteriaceae bacterium]
MGTAEHPSAGGRADATGQELVSTWRAGVAAALAKTRKVDVAALGENPERLLDTTTYDGVTVAALYTPADGRPEAPLPGSAPFTRGRTALRDTTTGWGIRVRHGLGLGSGADAAAVNKAVLDDLENGATSVWLALGGGDLPIEALETVLSGVFLDLAPVVLDAGEAFTEAAQAFLDLAERADVNLDEVSAGLGADPLTLLVRGGTDRMAEATALAVRAHEHAADLRAITLDGTVFHDAGGSDADELGATLAAGVEHLRALTDAGLSVDDALAQLEVRLAATDSQLLTIAKMRAWRLAWSRVAQVCGGADLAAAMPQHAVTSAAMMTQRDPWVNVLRTTVAVFAAGVGGADAITVLPFDAALPDGVAGVSEHFAARLARNTQLLLLEESHLGRVLDPAGGSWAVEALTVDLAEAAWGVFAGLEADGGFRAALASGRLGDVLARTRDARAADVDHRRILLTGVSAFPDLDETPPTSTSEPVVAGLLPVVRYSASFEALRNRSDAHLLATGVRPTVALRTIGPLAEHAARADWVRTLLAAGGISTTPTEGPAPVVVLCGSDRRYAGEGDEALAGLRADGADHVLLAGPSKAWPSGGPAPDAALAAGDDAVLALSTLLDVLEVAP